MEEDRGAKYMCKLCSKSFPCGRSLGGHMRSHVIYPTNEEKLQKMKRVHLVDNGGINTLIDSDAAAYDIRENPKKTYQLKDSSEDSLLHVNKLCKECGKYFQSWKALFGHMKCHSDKFAHTDVDEEDSWTSADRSENVKANPKRKRSLRRTKRYHKLEISGTTATSSSLSYNANASSSVSDTEQEQEEVALCLIMLSEDVSLRSGLKSIGKSVDNSEFEDAPSITGTKAKEVHVKKQLDRTLRDGYKLNRTEIKVGGLMLNDDMKKSKVVEELECRVSETVTESERTLIGGSISDEKADLQGTKKLSSSKRKVHDLVEPKYKAENIDMIKKDCVKRRIYECASCNKAFDTFQALGGHRASQKKMRGCLGLKTDGCENSITGADHNISPNQPADNIIPNEMGVYTTNVIKKIKKAGSHECSICFRVFLTGQALGGHKRSHLLADAKNNQSIESTSTVVHRPVAEIRDFLDLNLPAPDEEGTSTSVLGFSPWWIRSNDNHETMLGLFSN